ncbi:MAG: hypothetical protein CL868_07015 [Cytophagaceae bacterium]|nr:hypothetical protein [Cytophagaceae bacterium]|tara:strand:- start:34207 stop:36690 length:2484 start_codon:yes stop_codon:yes gene_type:complete
MGCSRKKDNWLSRNYHAVTSEYNTLYNGEMALDEGRRALVDTYRDNFWQILPVERLEVFEEITLPGENKNASFERAEEKAVKAIQKHSMQINGREVNPQMDEAFLLLGQARYYDQRFVRALEAFNYILAYYPASNNIAQAKVWKEKTNIRLAKENVAIENLHKLIDEEESLKPQDYADASAMLAQAYLNVDRKDSALVYIDKAARLTKKNEEKGRYYFIRGQIYDALGEYGLANESYDKVIALNRKSPRRYMVNAYIAKARNFDYGTEDRTAFYDLLKDLEKNRENRPYLDLIYNQIAEFYLNTEQIDSAVSFYNKSLRQNSQDKVLTSRNYGNLAEIHFNNAEYQVAGAYYDSTLNFLPERGRERRLISKKRENLNEVILYETTAHRNDSILRLVAMSDQERQDYFNDYVAQLRARDVEDSIAKTKNSIRDNQFFEAENTPMNPNAPGIFYFYDPTIVAQGKLDFEKRWGKRALDDNWRVSATRSNQPNGVASLPEATEDLVDDTRYNIETYISQIPSDERYLDSLAHDRNFAYYQLGLIYKEKFRENDLAAQRLESLLQQQPEERLVLPSKYNLYQIYSETGDNANSDKYKDDILTHYADSRYAQIIRNPEAQLTRDESSPEAIYNALYRKYDEEEYATVIAESDTYIDKFAGDAFVPKFELLKANALGRYEGFKAFEKALNHVALTYPNADEGKKAQQMIDDVLPQLADSSFSTEDSKNFKLIYDYPAGSTAITTAFEKLKTYLEQNNYTRYFASMDTYNKKNTFITVHGFDNEGAALAFAERLKNNEEMEWETAPIVITSSNYRVVQIHKNLDAYLNQQINQQ